MQYNNIFALITGLLGRSVRIGLVSIVLASVAIPGLAQEQKNIGVDGNLVHDAARLGTADELQKMLKVAPLERDAADNQGSQPIHFAAFNSDSGPLKALIAAGANPNARDINGSTPLHQAVYARNAENTRLLLEAGGDPKAKDNQGRDVLAMAHEMIANDSIGIISLWILKGCQPKKPC